MSSVVQRKPGQTKEEVETRMKAEEAIRKRSKKTKSVMSQYYVAIGSVCAVVVGAVLFLLFSPERGLSGTQVFDQDTLDLVNSSGGFTADKNSFFEGWSLADAKTVMGVSVSSMGRMSSPCATMLQEFEVPESFDSRQQWPECVEPIRNQGNCSSSWALSAASTLGERYCIKSDARIKPFLSGQDILSCDTRNFGCRGGFVDAVWEFGESNGFVDEECFAYRANSSVPCEEKCTNGQVYPAVQRCAVSGVAAIQREIFVNGPVVAPMLVYTDFLVYKGGVYRHLPSSSRFSSGHAIKIIGWGEEKGQKYWIIQNTWGEDWGENGYARIALGENECGMEDLVFTASPSLRKAGEENAEESESADAETEQVEAEEASDE